MKIRLILFSTAIVTMAHNPSLGAKTTDLFLFIGQSNMAGRAEMLKEETSPFDNVLLLNEEGEFVAAQNPFNQFSIIRKIEPGLQRLSPSYSFSEKMASYLQDTIAIIVQARGGTRIERFEKGGDWGYYEPTIYRLKNALLKYPQMRLRVVIVHHGESNNQKYESYIQSIYQVITDLRADLDLPELPFLYEEVGHWNKELEAINDQIRKIPTTILDALLASSLHLEGHDTCHFDRSSVLELGKRYAQLCIQSIYENKP